MGPNLSHVTSSACFPHQAVTTSALKKETALWVGDRYPKSRTSLLKRLVGILAIVLYGCATGDQGLRIVPDEVRWIEKERTTRAEVVARFGWPRVEFPQSSGFTASPTTTTTTITDSEGDTKTIQITTQIQRPTRPKKATYVYMRRDAAVFPFYDNLQWKQCQFWVVYDEKGVVQDYGFLGDACDGQLQDRGLHLAAEAAE
jgi:hypothetical protein